MYGSRWGSQYADPEVMRVCKSVWQKYLFDVTQEQVEHGFQRLMNDGLNHDYPPSLPKFRALCLDLDLVREAMLEKKAYHDEWGTLG